MKKHIKTVACLVAIIILCVSSFVVPCFAYEITDPTGDAYYTTFQPTVSVTYDGGDGYIEDKISLTAYEGMAFWSEALVVDDIYNQANNALVVQYRLMPHVGSNEKWTIDTGVIRVHDVDDYADWSISLNDDSVLKFRYKWLDNNTVDEGEITIEYDEMGGTFYLRQFVNENLDADFRGYIQVFITTETPGACRIRQYYYPGSTFLHDIRFTGVSVSDAVFIESVEIDRVPVGQFLWNSIDAFLSYELFPNIQLYHIFTTIIAIPLFIWFLKLFSGG